LTVRLRASLARPSEARALREAVAVDTPEYVGLSVRGADLEIRLTADSAASARATLDDLLACLKAAERLLASAGRGRP